MKKLLSLLLIATATVTFSLASDVLSKMDFTDVNGNEYTVQGTENGLTITGLENKVIFLEFFGYKCPPCLKSIPHLIKLQNKYKDKLAIVSIELQGYSTEETKEFVQEKRMNYIVASEDDAGEVVEYISQRAGWRGSIPFLVAVDTKGEVRFVQAGMIDEETLESLIEKLSK